MRRRQKVSVIDQTATICPDYAAVTNILTIRFDETPPPPQRRATILETKVYVHGTNGCSWQARAELHYCKSKFRGSPPAESSVTVQLFHFLPPGRDDSLLLLRIAQFSVEPTPVCSGGITCNHLNLIGFATSDKFRYVTVISVSTLD